MVHSVVDLLSFFWLFLKTQDAVPKRLTCLLTVLIPRLVGYNGGHRDVNWSGGEIFASVMYKKYQPRRTLAMAERAAESSITKYFLVF